MKLSNKVKNKIEWLEDNICDNYNISKDQLKIKCRKREIVYARMIIFKFMRTYTNLSLNMIGEIYFKDHATVLHCIKTFNDQYDMDKQFKQYIDSLTKSYLNVFSIYNSEESKRYAFAKDVFVNPNITTTKILTKVLLGL